MNDDHYNGAMIEVSLDGDQWCALIGSNLQEGEAGFGPTPSHALRELARVIGDECESCKRWKVEYNHLIGQVSPDVLDRINLDGRKTARLWHGEMAVVVAERDRLLEALTELDALVRGECPSLLNEDSGGDADLALKIEALLGPV